MSFRVERRFNLLILEEGEEYIADVSATMALVRRGQTAESKGRLRIASKSLVFQPDDVSASILKFPFRFVRSIGDAEAAGPGGAGAGGFPVECEQFVQVSTKTGTETRIVTPFTALKSKRAVHFHVHYANASEYLQIIRRLKDAAAKPISEADSIVRKVLAEVTADVQFDMSRLGHRETAMLQSHLWVRRVKPLLEVRGMLQLSNEAVYFQPHPNFSSDPVKRVPHGDVLHVFRRVYGVQANALEIITVNGSCLYLCFEAQGDCDLVTSILQEKRQAFSAALGQQGIGSGAEDVLHDIRRMTALWQSGLLSNFHYLDFLNCAAGRSQNDFSQYPIFPWVLQDYKSESLCLGESSVYRDLSKPMGALNVKRLEYFKDRMKGMSEEERFLYGTHYSTPAYVIYWLLREMPERMLRMHSGHFDALPRLFRSVPESWEAVNQSTASLMELIPEFFTLPAEWLRNDLGIATPEGPLADVLLPRWATGVDDFLCKMRAALESEWVSQHLPSWIDLIFGCKQRGEEAFKSDNLFHPVCYAGESGSQSPFASDLPISVLETQLQEFGRVPRQLFFEAHPPRLKTPPWEPNRLRQDKVQSQPWYSAVRHLTAGMGDTAEALSAASLGSAAVAPASAKVFSKGDGGALATSGGAANGSKACPRTAPSLRSLRARPATPMVASGRITDVACCATNVYAIGEDGCLRVSPLLSGSAAGQLEQDESPSKAMSMRRSFRISPMPLSALAVLRTDLLAIGGHDNTVTLYSSSSGTALAKCQAHADTVTCIGASPCRSVLVSGSRDQSIRTWVFTNSSLKNDEAFDDIQQPISCATASQNLILAGASDGQLMAWDTRSGKPVLDRELGGPVVGCALHHSEQFAMALDSLGDVRLWDFRRQCESLRLSVVARAGGGSLASATGFLTDFAEHVILSGLSSSGCPMVALWDIPEQRELTNWRLDVDGAKAEAQFLAPALPSEDATGGNGIHVPFVCADAAGAIHVFSHD